MTELTERDLHRVLDAVYAANDEAAGAGAPPPVAVALGELIRGDSTMYICLDLADGRALTGDVTPWEFAAVCYQVGDCRFARRHPAVAGYRTGRLPAGAAVSFTDLDGLSRMPVYTDFYRPRGVADQLWCLLPEPSRRPVATMLAINRSRRGFSTRDRQLLELAGPHLRQAAARHRNRLMGAAAARREAGSTAADTLPGLTPRQREVVAHVLSGASDQQIGRRLAISPRTVQKHLEQVYRTLGLGSRTSLIAAAHGHSAGRYDAPPARPAGRP